MLPESLQPYAKAVYPFVLTLLAVAVQFVVTGEYDKAELTTTLTGLSSSLVTYLVTNKVPVVDDVVVNDVPVSNLAGKAGEQ